MAEAEPFCAKASQESVAGKLIYGDFLFRRGKAQDAIQQYSEILRGVDPTEPDELQLTALKHRAVAKLTSGKALDARTDVEGYLALRPDDVQALHMFARSTSSNIDRVEFAQRLVTLNPGELEFHLILVDALIRFNKPEDAVLAAEAAVKLKPDSDVARTWLGAAYGEAGQYEKAEREHAAVARHLPNDPAPRVRQAGALVQLRRFPEAITTVQGILKSEPENVEALTVRAEARLNMGDGEGALADFESVQRIAGRKGITDFPDRANAVIAAHKAVSRDSLERLEADRAVIMGAVAAHMHQRCGNYRVPDYYDSENLNSYRDCILGWYKTNKDQNIAQLFTPETNAAIERFYGSRGLESTADALRCSKMPKKSHCVQDAAYLRFSAAFKGMDDPRVEVGHAEWDRLNREIGVYNARIDRRNALIKTANFLDALAAALSQQ